MEWRFVHPDINEWPLGRVSNAGSNPARCTNFMCESQISDGADVGQWKSERTHFHTPSFASVGKRKSRCLGFFEGPKQ